MAKLSDAVRKIVKDKLRAGGTTTLDDIQPVKSIGTERGIANIGATGTITGSGSNSSSQTGQPSTGAEAGAGGVTDPASDENGQVNAGQGGSGGAAGGGATSGDIHDVMDGAGTDTTLGILTGEENGTLSSVNFNTFEGIEYIPPDGWDDLGNDPSPAGPPDYEEGFFWALNSLGTTAPHNNPQSVADAYAIGLIPIIGEFPGVYTLNCFGGGARVYAGGFACNHLSFSSPLYKISCSGHEGEEYCQPLSGTGEDPWPSDGQCQIAFDVQAGGYKGHSSDPDCTAAQLIARNFVIQRSVSDPSKYYRTTRLASGGAKVTPVDAGGAPLPGGITKETDASGKIIGFYDTTTEPFLI